MRILVTGGAGFIGSHYVRTLIGGGYPGFADAQVTVLDKLTYAGNLANLEPVAGSPRYQFVQGDICDPTLLATVVPGHDAVINFAAETHVDRSIAGAADFVTTNVAGVQVLLQACLDGGVLRVVQVSTDEVYGSIASGSWTERSRLEPNSPYAAAKAGGDLLARAFARTHGLNVSITRCCNNYGPYQFPEKVIPLFITNLIDGRQVPLYGDGQNVRDWIHVSDHCAALWHVLELPDAEGGIFNVSAENECPNRTVTDVILRLTGRPPDLVRYVTDRPGHDRRYSLSSRKLRDLGWEAQTRFDEGLERTVQWYRDNAWWWEPIRSGDYREYYERQYGRALKP
jgi:dTDP-glucose 4,6-dehydratase